MLRQFSYALVTLSLILSVGTANAQTFVVSLATAPKIIDMNDVLFFGANAAEIGNWQYIYDVNVTSWNFAPRFTLSGFNPSLIVNQRASTAFGNGILTQKWDRTAARSSNVPARQNYGSYAAAGPTWLQGGIPSGVGGFIQNYWHAPADYTVSAGTDFSGGFPIPDYIRAGFIENPTTLSFNSKATSSTAQNGLIATIRLVHPYGPAGITYTGIQFGNSISGTVLGPAVAPPPPAVPEPSTLALILASLVGSAAVLYHRRRRRT